MFFCFFFFFLQLLFFVFYRFRIRLLCFFNNQIKAFFYTIFIYFFLNIISLFEISELDNFKKLNYLLNQQKFALNLCIFICHHQHNIITYNRRRKKNNEFVKYLIFFLFIGQIIRYSHRKTIY